MKLGIWCKREAKNIVRIEFKKLEYWKDCLCEYWNHQECSWEMYYKKWQWTRCENFDEWGKQMYSNQKSADANYSAMAPVSTSSQEQPLT
jgi:hypothetical protein